MGAQHTPGPWHWVETQKHEDNDMPRLVNHEGVEVCNFGIGEQYYPTEGTPPSDEDARLIAAAPELLAALQVISDNDPYAALIARAAIAKATGEQA